MTIKQLKRELNLTNEDIAGFFDLKYMHYANSTAKLRYESALIKFYEHIREQDSQKSVTTRLDEANLSLQIRVIKD